MKIIEPDSFTLGDFEPFNLAAAETVAPFIDRYRLCDYNFVNLCTWGLSYDIRGAISGDHLLILYGDGGMLFFPAGPVPDIDFLERLSRRMAALGGRGHFVLSLFEKFSKVHGLQGKYDPIADPEDANYIYLVSKLASLEGRKLRKKRNHVSQFTRNFPDYFTRELTIADLPDCVSLSEKWNASRPELTGGEPRMERKAMKTAFNNFNGFGLEGFGLFHGGKMCGFAIYSRQSGDMAMIHFEKYDPSMAGSSQTMTWELAHQLLKDFKFMNREQDLGLEGLRRAKMSLDPCEILYPSILVWLEGRDVDRPWERN